MPSSHPTLIHALMPHKEHYTHQNAGAVAMVCRDMIASSQYGDCVHVFGRALNHDPITRPYKALDPEMGFLFGNNIGLARAYLTILKPYPNNLIGLKFMADVRLPLISLKNALILKLFLFFIMTRVI